MTDIPNNEDISVEMLDLADDLFGPTFAASLRFDLDSAELKEAHREWLTDTAAPYLRNRIAFAEIYAFTDRSGAAEHNRQLSGRRLLAVQTFLSQNGVPQDKAFDPFFHKFFGERLSAEVGDIDGTRHAEARLVKIGLWKHIFKVPSATLLQFGAIRFGRIQQQTDLELD